MCVGGLVVAETGLLDGKRGTTHWYSLKELREKHNVQIGRTPNDILLGMLKVWDKLAQQEADRNPFFKKVYESQRRWAADVVTSRRTVHPAYEVAADYYWFKK